MFKLITKLFSSVKSFVTSLFSRTETSLNGVGLSLWTILVVVLIAGACLGVVVPVGGNAPPPPHHFEAGITQVVPAPPAVDYADASSVAAKLDVNLLNVQNKAINIINSSGTNSNCGVSKSPHNTTIAPRGDHADINFDLSVTHKKCFFHHKAWQHTSNGQIVVQVRPYVLDGFVKFKTEVVKTDMTKLYKVSNIRSQVKNELSSKFKTQIDDKYTFKLPDGAKVLNFQFASAPTGETHLIVDISFPMPPSA